MHCSSAMDRILKMIWPVAASVLNDDTSSFFTQRSIGNNLHGSYPRTLQFQQNKSNLISFTIHKLGCDWWLWGFAVTSAVLHCCSNARLQQLLICCHQLCSITSGHPAHVASYTTIISINNITADLIGLQDRVSEATKNLNVLYHRKISLWKHKAIGKIEVKQFSYMYRKEVFWLPLQTDMLSVGVTWHNWILDTWYT